VADAIHIAARFAAAVIQRRPRIYADQHGSKIFDLETQPWQAAPHSEEIQQSSN
jgi:hypothetical protein